MGYPKMTIVLGLVIALLAGIYIAGIEPKRAAAALNPPAMQAQPGAVLVIGGTRGTGLEVARILRQRGDDVVVLARPGSDAGEAGKTGARVVRGDALNPADLTAALGAGQFRAVVSTLGARTLKEQRPDYDGNRNAVDAARVAGVRRFVLITVIGAGDSLQAAPWIARRFLKNVIVDKTKAEDYLQASGLDYTIIRPGGLLDKEAQAKAYLTEDTGSMSWIRRTDLARLIVQSLDDPRAAGKTYHAFDPDRTRFWAIPTN